MKSAENWRLTSRDWAPPPRLPWSAHSQLQWWMMMSSSKANGLLSIKLRTIWRQWQSTSRNWGRKSQTRRTENCSLPTNTRIILVRLRVLAKASTRVNQSASTLAVSPRSESNSTEDSRCSLAGLDSRKTIRSALVEQASQKVTPHYRKVLCVTSFTSRSYTSTINRLNSSPNTK